MKKYIHFFLSCCLLAGLTISFHQITVAETVATAVRASKHAPEWDAASEKKLSSDTGAADPNIAARPYIQIAPNGTIMIVYNKQMTDLSTDRDPYYVRSTNNGTSWSAPAAIFTSPGEANRSLQVHFDYAANSVAHAVWSESEKILRYAREGTPWISQPLAVAQTGGSVDNPKIIASGSNTLDIVWAQNDGLGPRIRHTRSNNGGSNWSMIGTLPGDFDSRFPAFVNGPDGKLHVIWEQDFIEQGVVKSVVMYAQGTPASGNVTWSLPVKISKLGNGANKDAERPEIEMVGSSLQVTFTVRRNLSNDTQFVYLTKCSSGCTNASNWTQLSTPISGQSVAVNADSPTFIVSDLIYARGCLYAYFHGIVGDKEPNEQILGVNHCDNWSSSPRDEVTLPTTQAVNPSYDVSDEWMHLAYERASEQGGENIREIYYIRGELPPLTLYLPFIAKN
jgi:hypothetical protein